MPNEEGSKPKYSQVGYKKPPLHSQFQPGKSGNPKGRPKRSESVSDVLQKELNTLVPILKNGKKHKISMTRAIVKQLLNKAANGDWRAAAILFNALKLHKPDSGDNLGPLLQEFRALHLHRAGSESDEGRETDGKDNRPQSDKASRQ